MARVGAAERADDELAIELEHAAATAEVAPAIRLLTAAADLGSDRDQAARRVLAAAHRALTAGDGTAMRRLSPD